MIRVTGGELKGYKLKLPPSENIRPTSEKVKEAIFSILGSRTINCNFLDMFAGSGSVGIEALSRGADSCIFVEKNSLCCKIIKENIEKCRLIQKSKVIKNDVVKYIKSNKIENSIIFIDPPYFEGIYQNIFYALSNSNLFNSLIIVERFKKVKIPSNISNIKLQKERIYGDTIIDIFEL